MHPWHDCYLDEELISRAFPVVVEVMRMRDEKGIDDKIVAVSIGDPRVCRLVGYITAPIPCDPRDSALA
jgi:hypothetical protein